VVGVEPSEILTLRDEYLDFFPDQAGYQALAERAWMIDEFLLRPGVDGQPRHLRIDKQFRQKMPAEKVLLHGHCYQKAQPPAPDGLPGGVEASVGLLQAWGYPVETSAAGCCGMAGAFGYEREHYALSQQVAELSLLPAIRQAGPGCLVAAPGVSCQAQIKDFTNRAVFHPIELLKIDFYADFIVQFNSGKGGPKS
jgi:Fe-S oxidoreductase